MLFVQLVLLVVVGVGARTLWRELDYRRRGL
jgi:hypothetical protein